ncbi:hypothetical protein [Acetobacter fabarum]|uniref:hypothetical protein n=1 Tax=Acetobacter fabarum TaxID=483199 RepID=UPI0014055AB5|nr:hypothetical protein [Acetobacter fabarum]GBQ36096.1 hypothetical protein AA19596_1912 [Acetobacter fabarum DSM 19596]
MRTREEQITELAHRLACQNDRLEDGHIQDATGVILEAERRAEQRVRAEIARDSERLDWLLAHSHYGIPGFDPVVSGRTPEKRRTDLIQAIDAAREVG